MRSRLVAGAVLIVLGILTLFAARLAETGDLIPLFIGSALMVWFAFTRSYGLLIPGCIMTGIGAGVFVESVYRPISDPVVIGLGVGFVAIALIDWLMGKRRSGGWWPLIPGTVLLLVGIQDTAVSDLLWHGWPIALVVLGVILLLQGPKAPGRSAPDPTDKTEGE